MRQAHGLCCGRKDSIQKQAPRLCRMPDYYVTSAWPMLQSEGGWTLSQRLDSPGQKGLDNGPTIRPLSRKEQHTKSGTLTLQDARLPCGKRMAYTAVGGGLDAEYAIRLPDRKGSIQKRAPRLCRMPDCYATSAWPMLRSEGAYTLNMRLDSLIERVAYKNGHPDFAGCPIAMR